MQFTEWSVFILLLKLASYFAVLAMAGSLVMRFLNSNSKASNSSIAFFYHYLKRRQLILLGIGLIAALLQIPIEAGAMAETGLAGMTDKFMLEIIWQSVIGDQAVYRVLILLIALVATYYWQTNVRVAFNTNFFISLSALCAMAYTFTLTGHSASESLLIRLILSVHIIAIACWVGSLWPLYKSCHLFTVNNVKTLMHRFGQLAIVIVLVLVSAGIALLTHNISSIGALFTSNYGQTILLKMFLVSAMLLLGAWHKLQLVPKITQKKHIVTLNRSITVEMCIALLVLITTSIFTTLLGPTS